MPATASSPMIWSSVNRHSHAWPKDPKIGSPQRFAAEQEILVIRLDPAEMDEETRSRSADGIVAYSAICTHAGCSVTGWLKSETGDKDVLKCFCHNSEFNPRERAQVVFGPAPASAGTAAGNRRWLAHHSCNIRWKGRCSTTGVMGRGLISEAALRNRNSSFVIDGEAVLLGADGRSDFNGLHFATA